MNETARTWYILRIALVISGLIVIFFSGIFPVEDYLALVTPSQLTASVVASDVATLTNQNRTENGLPALMVSPLLTQAAQLKANDMAQNSYYAHISPDGKSPLYWLTQVGYQYLNAGENLVIDRTTSEQAVDAWMNSADHRENILRPQFTEFGIGIATGQYQGVDTIFVVQEFGTPYPLSVSAIHKAKTPVVAVAPAPAPTPVTVIPTPVTPVPTKPLALPTPSIITDIKALVSPLVHSIAPVTTPKPKPMTPTKAPVTATTTASSTVMTIATSTSAVTASSTAATTTASINYTLPAEFFTPVLFSNLHEEVRTAGKDTVPATQNPTPSWIGAVRSFILRITDFVPRIW
ncbi:MAG: hypothetical protein JWL75_638 [Parcubacteria group bacterium]|nr:hypothetical protein [Parcubacteria group bacterium]